MAELTQKAMEEAMEAIQMANKKRKRSSSGPKSSAKKLKLDKPSAKKKEKGMLKGQSKLSFKPKTAAVVNRNGLPNSTDSSSEDSDSPLSSLKKCNAKSKLDSDDSDTPLAVIKMSPRKSVSPKKKPSSQTPKKSARSPEKKIKSATPKKSPKKKAKNEVIDSDDSDIVLSKLAPVKRGRGRPMGSPNKKVGNR